MPHYPSARILSRLLNLSPHDAIALRRAMYHDDPTTVIALANTMMHAHGVEGFTIPSNCSNPDHTIEYVNKGDTYAITLLFHNGKFKVGAWGDIVEQFDNNQEE